ncbi:MAG TPA: hypothetical protein VF905_12440 [Nitrospirota bacterium]
MVTEDLTDLPKPLTETAGPETADLPIPPPEVVRGIIALIPARGIIDPPPAPGIIPVIALRDLARVIIRAAVARDFIAASLFLPMAGPKGASMVKEGPYSL